MPLQSDLNIDAAKFQPGAVSEQVTKLNEQLLETGKKGPNWWEVGAPKYREMRWNGETPFPKPTVIESGKAFSIPSRDKGREIPCRLMMPEERGPIRGIYMHIHGGGWVLMDENTSDPILKWSADSANIACISVGYRLAPEHPFPAAPEDCYDAAEWLVDNANEEFGGELMFTGGESAGGHLAALTCFHLRESRPNFHFRGLILHFGAYDISQLPRARNFIKPLILSPEIMEHFNNAFLPHTTPEQRRNPSISPFFKDLDGMTLPSALFTCGTEDCLLDDTMFMATKWQMSGAEAVVKIFPGAPHGYIAFPDSVESAKEGRKVMRDYLIEKVG
ncbi:MAG: hypothetical protein M1827_000495 [Pycnora praestabilis]|nr:MAG: hypothetical protein M1827_000495 [Pycnora praestabilis]